MDDWGEKERGNGVLASPPGWKMLLLIEKGKQGTERMSEFGQMLIPALHTC